MLRHLLLVLTLLVPACTAPAPTPEVSVKPGINSPFLDPEMQAEDFVRRFEGESREVYALRQEITQAAQIHANMDIADIGSGTGLFLPLFTAAVGKQGSVFAVDLSPSMLAHLRQRKADEYLQEVIVHECGERSVDLPSASIDLAFICDTYHHFEYPRTTIGTLHDALREGGEVVIVDFERIPGTSRNWILSHVRCGKETVIQEMRSFDFELIEEVKLDGLKENYLLRFRKS